VEWSADSKFACRDEADHCDSLLSSHIPGSLLARASANADRFAGAVVEHCAVVDCERGGWAEGQV